MAAARPYRLRELGSREQIRYRYYTRPGRAHDAALLFVYHSSVGTTIELFNINTRNTLSVYVRTAKSVDEYGAKDARQMVASAAQKVSQNHARARKAARQLPHFGAGDDGSEAIAGQVIARHEH